MNIHEHQAKEILKEFGAPVSKGIVIFSLNELDEKFKELKSSEFVVKAQIHAGGRGKGGGVKLVKNYEELKILTKEMFGMNLITHQTGPSGKKVKRIYIEEASDISKEFYLSCLVDRASSKIAFISSTEGGMDIEKVAAETPEKIITNKVDYKNDIELDEIEKIIKPFNFNPKQKMTAHKLIKAIYKILTEIKVKFKFIDKDVVLENWSPLIELSEEKKFKQVRFSPRLDFVPILDKEKLDLYYKARNKLSEMYNSDKYKIEFKLSAKDLIMMDNYRLLHGRTAYQTSEGERFLQGCYIDYDSTEGKLRHLKRKFNL